jgi:CHAT domain-containing protein
VEVVRYKHYDPSAGGKFADDIGYAFLIVTAESGNNPALIEIPGGKDLETKYLRSYRNHIRYNLADEASYNNYFGMLADFLRKQNITRLFFSPDGVYNKINLNTLENPSNKKFVIDEFDVRLVTNTRELLETETAPGNAGSSTLIGFPKFNLDENELLGKPVKGINRGGISRTWRGGLLRYVRGEEGISLLPGTKVEIEKIAALFGESAIVLRDQDASEQAARNVNNPKVLHIATHGYFLEDEAADDRPARSYFSNPLLNAGLILAGAENFLTSGEPVNNDGDDGILTAFEAMNLKLDATRLVVLSACETGLGDVQNGEGVYGLQRAFKLAGTQSIVMSLWNVDDEATQILMTTFYEEMLRTDDQHNAFRYAQQKVKEKFPSAFYWGAFIMVGI